MSYAAITTQRWEQPVPCCLASESASAWACCSRRVVAKKPATPSPAKCTSLAIACATSSRSRGTNQQARTGHKLRADCGEENPRRSDFYPAFFLARQTAFTQDSNLADVPRALNPETALESNDTNSSALNDSPSNAITPSAKSPPASSTESPTSTAVRFVSTLWLFIRRRIAFAISAIDFLYPLRSTHTNSK